VPDPVASAQKAWGRIFILGISSLVTHPLAVTYLSPLELLQA